MRVAFRTNLDACVHDVASVAKLWPVGHVPAKGSRIQFNGYQLAVVDVVYVLATHDEFGANVELSIPSSWGETREHFEDLVRRSKGAKP